MKARRLTYLLLSCLVCCSGCNQTVSLLLEQVTSEADSSDESANSEETVISGSKSPENVAEVVTEESERGRKIRSAEKRKKKKYQKDLRELNAAVSLADGSYMPYLERAQCHVLFGNNNRAIKDASKAIELAGGEGLVAYVVRAQAWTEAGNYNAALSDVEEAISLNPEMVSLSFLRGFVYEKQGNYENALYEYQMSLEASEEQPLVWNNYASVLCLAPDDSIRDGEKAVAAAIQAVQHSEGALMKATALDTLGAAWAELGNFEKALKSSKIAFKTAPSDAFDELKTINDNIKLFEAGKTARYPVKESKVAEKKAKAKNTEKVAVKKSKKKTVARRAPANNDAPMKITRSHYNPTTREAINE